MCVSKTKKKETYQECDVVCGKELHVAKQDHELIVRELSTRRSPRQMYDCTSALLRSGCDDLLDWIRIQDVCDVHGVLGGKLGESTVLVKFEIVDFDPAIINCFFSIAH